MAMKDYAKKKRRKVGRRAEYSKYDDSDRSFAKIVRSNRSGRKSLLSNPMFLMVSAVGLVFLGSVIYLEDFKNLTNDLFQPEPQVATAEKTLKVPKKTRNNIERELRAEKKVPKFEFYHTLPKMVVSDKGSYEPVKAPVKESIKEPVKEVAKTDEELKVASILNGDTPPLKLVKADKSAGTVSNQPQGNSYFLQLASFKNLKDAQSLKAKLTLSGFDVIIQTVLLPSGETWHRVKSNKINNIELAMNLHSQLKVHQIDSIILSDNT